MEGALNSGDTAWLLVCCSLVLLMTPALALFYGGMVRRKNLLSTLTLSYIFMALAGVQWVLYGYSLAFGQSINGLIGGLNFLGFEGVGKLYGDKTALSGDSFDRQAVEAHTNGMIDCVGDCWCCWNGNQFTNSLGSIGPVCDWVLDTAANGGDWRAELARAVEANE